MSKRARHPVVVGTRRSKLARWQTDYVVSRLKNAWPDVEFMIQTFVTEGDAETGIPLARMGGRGVFTSQLEAALAKGEIDIAVHSLKDLPTEENPALVLAAVSTREDPRDCLVARDGSTLDTLPHGARVGTSSTRREAQLRSMRPDLSISSIRGNVETRIRKVTEGEYDATLLAAAGLKRLELDDAVTEWIPLERMLPAPGQAALGIQCRADDDRTRELLGAIDDPVARRCVTAERTFLEQLGGGCSLPIAAFAESRRDTPEIHMTGIVTSPNGRDIVKVEGAGEAPEELGTRLATSAIEKGALRVLESASDARQLLPLAGKRIVVTRAANQSRYLCERLKQLGATPVLVPAIRIIPVEDTTAIDDAIANIGSYDWVVFTSTNAVEMFLERMGSLGRESGALAGARIAAVGPATEAALASHGIKPDFVPDEFIGDAIASGLGELSGRRLLLPRADIAREELPDLLRRAGAVVDDVAVYRTLPAPFEAEHCDALAAGVDAVTFTSGSTARNFAAALRGSTLPESILDRAVLACIGPATTNEARKAGLRVDVTAESYTSEGIIEALVRHFATT